MNQEASIKGLFPLAWKGKLPLVVVWWGIGIPTNIVSNVLTSDWAWKTLYVHMRPVGYVAAFLVLSASIAITIMAWRCAPNVKNRLWTWVARTLLGLSWLLALGALFS